MNRDSPIRASLTRAPSRTDPHTGRPLRDRRLIPNPCLRALIAAAVPAITAAAAAAPAITTTAAGPAAGPTSAGPAAARAPSVAAAAAFAAGAAGPLDDSRHASPCGPR